MQPYAILFPFGQIHVDDNAITVLQSVTNYLRLQLPDEQALPRC